MANKSRNQLESELQLIKNQRRADNITTVINNLIKWAGLVAIFYIAYLSIVALSGKYTVADIGINILANVTISQALAWIFGTGGILYGVRQRLLRRKNVERLQQRIKDLEKGYDPRRTSSGLTTRGDTHPGDK